MRKKEVRRGRQCIFPEVPRTHTFGKFGSHGGEHYDNHLSKMIMNTDSVDWSKLDLQYLLHDNYKALMQAWLSSAVEYSISEMKAILLQDYCNVTQPDDARDSRDIVVTYQGGVQGYTNASKLLHPMLGDLREGSPRASYDGIVIVRCRGRRLFLKPDKE